MSPPEARLWNLLRREPFDVFHFRRQVPLGPYCADFASHRARLVIEVDGASHTFDEAIRHDDRRTAFLQTQGYRVLRFTTLEVLGRLEAVAAAIFADIGPSEGA
jgi:very-short-patch-repair endonuclease